MTKDEYCEVQKTLAARMHASIECYIIEFQTSQLVI
jgi:hypothetical protein